MSITKNLYTLIKRGKDGNNRGLSTGLPKLDKIIYGIQHRCLITCGGDTGSGKSTFVLYTYVYRALTEMLENGADVQILYFSFEMSAEVLFAKLLSLYIFDKYSRIITYEDILSLTDIISDEDFKFIEKARGWLETIEDKISIIDKTLSPDQIDSVLRQWHEAFGSFEQVDEVTEIYKPNNPLQYRIAVLDHMGLINGIVKPAIDDTCKSFIYYRNICSMTGVMVQQLNRNFKDMSRKNSVYNTVQLNDYEGSSGPAHASEIVIGIFDAYREKMKTDLGYDISQLNDRYRGLRVLKNRFGLSNKGIGVAFYGEIGLWKELPKAEDITDYAKYTILSKKNLSTSTEQTKVQNQKEEIKQKSNLRLTLD